MKFALMIIGAMVAGALSVIAWSSTKPAYQPGRYAIIVVPSVAYSPIGTKDDEKVVLRIDTATGEASELNSQVLRVGSGTGGASLMHGWFYWDAIPEKEESKIRADKEEKMREWRKSS